MIESNLNLFKKDVYSQFGEDGIIEELINRLEKKKNFQCCEFGAWDGEFLSNTCNLIRNKNYKAILIEPDKKKFRELNNNFKDNSIIKINSFVEVEGKNSLDNILKTYKFDKNFDFLSIDVDGNDYHLFDSLKIYTPKIICIEFNPSIPNEVEFFQINNVKLNQGSSILSLANLAKTKGYSPVAATYTNLFLINNNYLNLIVEKKNLSVSDIRDDSHARNFIFFGYDGEIFTSRSIYLPWHGISLKKIRFLPQILNKYPPNYNYFQIVFFLLFKIMINPFKYLKKIIKIFKNKK
jgi:hypothetical protein